MNETVKIEWNFVLLVPLVSIFIKLLPCGAKVCY